MENATKALLMAAGVLIGILMLSIFVLVFKKSGQFLESIDTVETTELITQYNSKLIDYNRDNNNIFDVISACNKAFDINYKNMFDEKDGINIYIIIKDDRDEYRFERNGKVTVLNDGHKDEYDITNEMQKKIIINLITQKIKELEIDGETVEINLSTITVQDAPVGSNEEEIHKYMYTFSGKTEYDNWGKINQITFRLNDP